MLGTLGKGLIAVWMTAGLGYVFLKLPPAVGFNDPELARIVTLHLPCAYTAVILAFVAGWHAMRYLKTRDFKYDRIAVSSAEIGVVFLVMGLLTGMIWARPTWNMAIKMTMTVSAVISAACRYMDRRPRVGVPLLYRLLAKRQTRGWQLRYCPVQWPEF